ncbi:putative rhamnosyl transferase [Ruegeria sp.]|uniref:putative rhamnosyl transferase n=1 Tax=Ruegeria sp. TaxID=1879320 RepID=UPI00231698AC|nr:putative rhamnosyl transferase [Ruegeria sp.]MDA7965519.1 putative rhamnosyl transferase [Ruegeria sp.]
MQVIGLCRFSYPAVGGFQIEHDTVGDRRRYLYAPDRLEERFRLFETLTLPGLQAQTDEDFDFVIVIGDCLPKAALDRLHDLTSGMPQVRIIAQAPGEHRTVMKRILNTARRDTAQPCLQFRLDDDDAVAVNFVEHLRRAKQDCGGLFEANKTVAIDFNHGFLAEVNAEGMRALPQYRSLVSAGLGMYVQGGCDLTIMNFAHQRMGHFMPVISYPDEPMWIRSLNGFNDSPNAHKQRHKLAPLDDDQRAIFAQRFALYSGA